MLVSSRSFSRRRLSAVALIPTFVPGLVLGAAALVAGSSSAAAQTATRFVSAAERSGTSLGLESPSAPVSATVWLNLHNKAELDQAIKEMYTPGSPNFHKWMTKEDIKRFEPTAAELAAVKAELAAHHLTVVSSDPANLSVKFKGQTSDFESAFHTQLGRYQVKSQTVRRTLATPSLAGAATGLAASVTGFSPAAMRPFHTAPTDPETGKQLGIRPVTAGAHPDGAEYSAQCLYPLKTVHLTGGSVSATYSGIGYGAPITNTEPGTLPTCGYQPSDVWKLYHLNGIYGKGYEGQGQTVAIVDAYGSPTISADAATFNSIYNLPAFTPTSFQIYAPGPIGTPVAGWDVETTLDVEWAHSIAPKANIALITAITNYDDDLQLAVLYAVINHLGDVVSNSYGEPETFSDPETMSTWDEVCEFAAAMGVSVNFATGDHGDYAAAIGLGYTDVSSPADSPYATAVGGTSVALSPVDGQVVQTGWGNNITRLSYKSGAIADPPLNEGFIGGGGGGISSFFAKPAYQAALAGPGRHLPDVSALADPYTGVEIIFTVDGSQYFEVYGGTSLATPIFSGMWALANQAAGIPLGQAAPYVAAGASLLTDIVGTPDPLSVSGSITDKNGTTHYSSVELSEPLENTTGYTGALYQGLSTSYYNLTFGTDSSLTVTPGWDDVTGYGSPDFGIFGK